MEKRKREIVRKKRIRAKINGTKKAPRLTVERSNKNISGQLIDDLKGETIVSYSSLSLKKGTEKMTKNEIAFKVGEEIASLAKKKGIKKAVFDKGGYKYHGRVKSLADGARKSGLKF